jgi:diketogulonate reductase-like aldo/keto reductase
LTYSGHGAWDGPAPAGDPSKPKPGTPYYVTAPPEPAFDKSKEDVDVPLGQAGAVVGRVPLIGVDAVSLVTNEKLRASVASGAIRHVQCPAMSSQGAAAAFAAAKAAIATTSSAFVSGVVSTEEARDPESAIDDALAALGIDAFDLVVLEWPVAATLREDWARLETLVRAGKAKAIGLANASVPIVETVCAFSAGNPSGVKPAANVVEAHPLMAHRKLVGVCRRYGVVVIARAITGLGDARLTQHESLKKACAIETCGRASISAVAALARWSAQRGVPFVADASCADAADAATALDFRLTNAQKVLVDAMEPPPRQGGVRFVEKPAGIDFEWDDPFLGGVARPGLDLEKMNL